MEDENVYDVKMKPKLLDILMNDQLPKGEELRDDFDMMKVVRAIRNLGLLSEAMPLEVDPRTAEYWAATVDEWTQRVLHLVASPTPGCSWVGFCLLGLTAQECRSERLLAMYNLWFDEFLVKLKTPSNHTSVEVVACASLADLLARLNRFPNMKADVVLLARRIAPPALELLYVDVAEEDALALLYKILQLSPASLQSYYEKVESSLVSRMISAHVNNKDARMLKYYAYCLASLPKSRGDKASWFSMMKGLIVTIDLYLNHVFQGSGEEKLRAAPIGGRIISDDVHHQNPKRAKQLLISIILTLLLSCCTMITNPYPVQVNVPVQGLLTLVGKVLMLHKSLSQDSSFSSSETQHGLLYAELPSLQLSSLDLLAAIIKGACSQLGPYLWYTIRLLRGHLRGCLLPVLRIKTYTVIRTLLLSIGLGAALHISDELIGHVFIDLDASQYASNRGSSYKNLNTSSEASIQPGHTERHPVRAGFLGEQQDREGLEVYEPNKTYPLSLKIAALECLETFFTVDASLRPSLRRNIDLLLMNVAADAYDGKWSSDEVRELFPSDELTSADLLLAALRALLASLLSQHYIWPEHLAKGLWVFYRGKRAGEKVAEFCNVALLSLGVMHHRKVSYFADAPYRRHGYNNEGMGTESSDNTYLVGLKKKSPNVSLKRADNPSKNKAQHGCRLHGRYATAASKGKAPAAAAGSPE